MQEKRVNILRTYTYETIQARIQRLETVMGFHSPGGTYCHGVGEQEPLLEHPSKSQTFPHLHDRPHFTRLTSRKPQPRPRSANLPHELIQEQYIEMSSTLNYEPVIQRNFKGSSLTLVQMFPRLIIYLAFLEVFLLWKLLQVTKVIFDTYLEAKFNLTKSKI